MNIEYTDNAYYWLLYISNNLIKVEHFNKLKRVINTYEIVKNNSSKKNYGKNVSIWSI